MKVDDRASGILSIAGGAAVAAYAWSFPAAPGHPVGPAAFPVAIGCALVIAGALLVKTGTLNISAGLRSEMLSVPVFPRNRRLAVNFLLVLAAVIFYALAVERLGFLIAAILVLGILFAAFDVPRARILPLAAAVTLVIHFAFYTLLRVPLPWGVLEGIAW